MGFDLSLVESEERYHGAFVCPICQNLVDDDALVTSACSHCFCKGCLPTWLQRSSHCPSCNHDLLFAHNSSQKHLQSMMIGDHTVLVQPLNRAQPLAHRLLMSLLVKCPLDASVGCRWKGDYGDLAGHLLSATAHAALSTVSTEASGVPETTNADSNKSLLLDEERKRQQISLASSLKLEANGKFESKHFREAQALYTKAIQVVRPFATTDQTARILLAALYSNRAAATLQSQDFSLCLQDCQTVIQEHLDDSNVKVYIRAARACIQLGDLAQAKRFLVGESHQHAESSYLLEELAKLEALIAWELKGKEELDSQQYASAKVTFGKLLKAAPAAVPFLLGAARADLGLGLTDSALRLTKRILLRHPQNPAACWIRGQAAFLMGDAKIGLQLLQEALRLDPDSETFKKSYKQAKQTHSNMVLAQKNMFSRKFQETVELLDGCLEMCHPLPSKSTLYATIYTQRAEALLRLKKYPEAMKDCALVLYAQEDHIPAWLIRFQAHHGLGEHSAALEQVKDLLHKWPQDHRLRQAYERADFLHRKQNRVNYYDLLDVSSIASEVEIKKAYKRKALELHPDKLPPGSSVDEQRKAQQRFQQLGEALEILTDDFQRKLYDEGYDASAIRERVEAAKQAAHNHRGGYSYHGHPHH